MLVRGSAPRTILTSCSGLVYQIFLSTNGKMTTKNDEMSQVFPQPPKVTSRHQYGKEGTCSLIWEHETCSAGKVAMTRKW